MSEDNIKHIRHQIAHCMAFYGDSPEELMYKLENLTLEWFTKGYEEGLKGLGLTRDIEGS